MNTWWYLYVTSLYQLSCRCTRDDIYIPQLDINFPADEHRMIYTYCNFISTFLETNTGGYIHTATLYQFCWRWTTADIDIPELYINFPADEHVMIYTYRNFVSTFLQMIPGWYIHILTLYQFSCRWTRDDIYIYRNFIWTFLQMNTWLYIDTATLYQLSCRWTRDDIYIPELYINFPADAQQMIYTYRNFISTFLQMNTWWYIHAETLYQFSCSCTRDDIYIAQLYINILGNEHVMIYTYRNFISTLLQMNTWWYIHTATLYQLSCSWAPDDIDVPKLYLNFPGDKRVIIYTYGNFISTFLQMNTWWYIHTVTLYQFSLWWTRDDIYIPQLYINFSADEHLMIYTYHNFISIFLQMNTWWYLDTWTLYQVCCRCTRGDIYIPQLYINFPAQ